MLVRHQHRTVAIHREHAGRCDEMDVRLVRLDLVGRSQGTLRGSTIRPRSVAACLRTSPSHYAGHDHRNGKVLGRPLNASRASSPATVVEIGKMVGRHTRCQSKLRRRQQVSDSGRWLVAQQMPVEASTPATGIRIGKVVGRPFMPGSYLRCLRPRP